MPTREEIEAARTPKGGWTRAQLAEWGVPWPPPKGWKKALEFGHDLDVTLAKTGPQFGIYPRPLGPFGIIAAPLTPEQVEYGHQLAARLANRAALRDTDPDRLPWE